MALLGVRSFSPDEASYIRFFSPLTLIVGPNGSGKTTIIESMRYACTGDLPPNSKGGAFVNDPTVSGHNEVKAQIRLKFYNINGQKMICSRSLAVSRKRGSLTQKSIDNSLLRYDPISGEAFSVSSRCADMDAELPLHLGVPKAILDNVIFCHQEESNWPLSESSVLKKKFDDIFSSKRYQVAIDNIKEIRKETLQEIKLGNIRLEALKSDAEKAKRVRQSLTELNRRLSQKTEQHDTVSRELTSIDQQKQALNQLLRDINLVEDNVQQCVNKQDFYQSTMQSMETHLKPRDESTEELKRLLAQHHTNEHQNQQNKHQIQTERVKHERKLKRLQDELDQKHLVMGRLEAAREEHERQIQLRHDWIDQFNQSHDTCFSLNEEAADQVRQHLQRTVSQHQKIKEEAMTQQNHLSDELQVLKSQLMSIQETKKFLVKNMEQTKSQMEQTKNKIKQFHVSTLEIDAIDTKVQEYQRKLDEIQTSPGVATEDDLMKKERELKGLDDKISDLNDELASLSKQNDAQAKLSIKRADKETRETTLNKIYQDCIKDVEQLLGFRPSVDKLEGELDTYRANILKKLQYQMENRNKATRELSAVEARLRMTKQQLSTKQQEVDKYTQVISSVCGDKNLAEEIKRKEVRILKIKEQVSNMQGATMIYDRLELQQQNQSCCPMCTKAFNDQSEIDAFKSTLEQMRNFIPAEQEKLRKISVEEEKKLAKFKQALNVWMKLETVKKDIAGLKQSLEAFESEKEAAVSKTDVASTEFAETDGCKIKADKLLLIARNVNRIYKEIESLNEDMMAAERELGSQGARTRTMSDVQKELEEISERSKSVRRDIKRIHTDMDVQRRRVQAVELSLRDSREKKLKLEHDLNSKVALEYQLEDLKEQLQDNLNRQQKAEQETPHLKEKVLQITQQHDQATKEWKLTEEKLNEEEYNLTRFKDRLEEFNLNLKRSANETGSQKTTKITKEIAELQQAMDDTKQDIINADERLALIEKDEADKRGIERELQDQIKYREMKAGLAQCDEDLRELEEKLNEFDREQVMRDLSKVNQRESELIEKRGALGGEVGQMRDQIKRYQAELANDYSQVDSQYGKLFIEVKTQELANADLEKYSKVLQTAIMKYHSLKMQDLNKIIKELWMDTYKGGDIDYIEVRADSEGTTARQSFNYRVVMMKNGTELNMRGRCSAGQKVLASIIIRLALAETFCVNCGIFTLDEPTTNLDRDNIESLAENLARIIQNRKQQSNFQFVIITHDEEFVEFLSRNEILDKYYRVQKDHNQYSTITLKQETGPVRAPRHNNDNDE
ncbi:DNA repair protein RAD50 [Choanephora cucurbitarum]|uniref:DNA repair protein RAD50 n=2 Tax=Choanephora cucurbitarum TaxID=101091 RepID=A0A1C7NPN6_9FUNG|nr:DNA repair protein RAD50 [Choanephora cucurbitarum]